MEPEESGKEKPGTGQDNAVGTGPGGHGNKDERDKDTDGHDPVTLPDGELVKVKGLNTVYAISGGKRLPLRTIAARCI